MKASAWHLLVAAWIVALMATLGALLIGEVMGQAPCELCWYQRIAMFPLAWILGVAAFRGNSDWGWYALPLTAAGTIVAAFHSLIFLGVLTEAIHQCGAGPSCTDDGMLLFGIAPIPLLSLLAFIAVGTLLIMSLRRAT